MATDKQRLLALLADFGIAPEVCAGVHGGEPVAFVRLVAHEGGVNGYSGFSCEFAFDPDGKFDQVGVWE